MRPFTRVPWTTIGIVGALLLAGCLDLPGDRSSRFNGDWEPGPSRQCIADVCLTDPEAPYARYVKEEYGLTIIADSPNQLFPRGVDGDWAVFQFATGGRGSWILAYNLTSDYLVEADGRGSYHMTRTHLVDERAVIAREPRSGAEVGHSHMLLWDLGVNESRVLETGMGGSVPTNGVLGFDGRWALFGNRGSDVADENALWGLDVDSGELVQVYRVPDERDEDGWEERMGSAGIHGGHAFYALRQTHPDHDHRYIIGSVEMETGERTIHYEGNIRVSGGPELAVGPRYVVWTAGVDNGLWALDIAAGEIFEFSKPGEDYASPELGGGWAVYRDSKYGQRGIIAVNLDSGERKEIRTGGGDVGFGGTITDGEIVVGSLNMLMGGMSLPHENPSFPYRIDLDDIGRT